MKLARALAALAVAGAVVAVPAVAASADNGHELVSVTINNNNLTGGLCIDVFVGEASQNLTILNLPICLPPL